MLNLFLRCLLSGVFFVGTATFAQTAPSTSPATTTASDDDAVQQLSWPRTIQDATGMARFPSSGKTSTPIDPPAILASSVSTICKAPAAGIADRAAGAVEEADFAADR